MKWYKMDCDIQDNLDMRKLIDEWGWDWFGRYCAIIGKVGMLVTEHSQTFALQTNDGRPFPVKLLANDCSTTVERMTDFCKYLADNRLIDKDSWYNKNLIFIPKLRERADEYTKKLLTKSRQYPDQEEEVEEDKKKSTKIEKFKFENIWIQYPNRQGKKNALRHFGATVKTMEDYENVCKAMANYLDSANVKKGFIKNGSTWFNEWQDWINPTNIMLKGSTDINDKPTSIITNQRKYQCRICNRDIPKTFEGICPECEKAERLKDIKPEEVRRIIDEDLSK